MTPSEEATSPRIGEPERRPAGVAAGGRPRVGVTGVGDPDAHERVRRWLVQSGADVVDEAPWTGTVVLISADARRPGAPRDGGPTLDVAPDTPRETVAAFVRALRGKAPHTFDDHGSAEAWPRGSY